MLKELVKIANKLDIIGLTKEADVIDNFLSKIAKSETKILPFTVLAGNTFSQMYQDNTAPGISIQEQVKLNKEKYSEKGKAFDPNKLAVGQVVYFHVPLEAEVPIGHNTEDI